MLNFKPAFSFSSFTFIKRLNSSSSLSAIKVVSCAYLRLLIFLPAILIPACASFSLLSHIRYSAYINNLRYTDDTTLMAESEEELNNLLMKMKEESSSFSGSSAFSNSSLNIWKFSVHVLLKSSLENFEHYFAST